VDLLTRAALDLSKIEYLVFDEADRMLDLGFVDDITKIVDKLPTNRQTLLFSATLSGAVLQLAKKYTQNAVHISTLDADGEGQTVEHIENFVYLAHHLDKPELLSRMLQGEPRQKSIIFTRTKSRGETLCLDLKNRGFNAYLIHGGLDQKKRERVLDSFKNASVDVSASEQAVLVASDVIARGIDIENISHVYNYECPNDTAAFLHRTGRTGRAGGVGTSITLVDWEDLTRWEIIAKDVNIAQTHPQETYSSSSDYRAELGISEDAGGYVNGVTKETARHSVDNGRNNRRPKSGPHNKNRNNNSNTKNNRNRNNNQSSKSGNTKNNNKNTQKNANTKPKLGGKWRQSE
jgi:superfamily II DNA/RNA helicase